MNTFYTRLRELRKSEHKSITALSEETGISYRTLQSYELKDRTPAIIDTLIILADYFNVSLDYLCGRSDER